ncbi:ribonuclease P protein component 1 [Natronocalculus amylovorans]|uniref:Ribonuclease P protein component 1 n=1 Tax=Natronocalculus amylovorans TaxID=2917812 RepID=A0AAE3FVW9_9EURY|nr:ribonuclease P protein component 1 [Natronocalculus amylovorans]MCL9816562.1 ribonuclease P protein component 1 [Natronocalculus amylovorans]NUE01007.1 ribonuclease P protein component 1 [Halorubraceae archaeon YAN]
MALTPETLTRHELIGLHMCVADAPNPDLVGISGRIVSETMQTVVVETQGETKQVQKQDSTFEFCLPVESSGGQYRHTNTDEAAGDRKVPGSSSKLGSETAGEAEQKHPRQSAPSADASQNASAASLVGRDECEGGVYVTVDATTLLSRPAERTEFIGDSKWR